MEHRDGMEPSNTGFADQRVSHFVTGAISLPKTQLENEFLKILSRLRATPETIAEFLKVAAKVWAAQQQTSEWEIERLNTHLDNEKTLRSQLVRMRARGEMTVEDYERERAEVTVQIYEIEERIRETTPGNFEPL